MYICFSVNFWHFWLHGLELDLTAAEQVGKSKVFMAKNKFSLVFSFRNNLNISNKFEIFRNIPLEYL